MKFYTNLLNKELKRSRSKSRIKELPIERRATKNSIFNLEKEINSQIQSNNIIREKSFEEKDK